MMDRIEIVLSIFAGLVACVLAYATFEMFPMLYGKHWLPAITIGGWWFAVMAAIGFARKQLGYNA
jgi:hypothetical protein